MVQVAEASVIIYRPVTHLWTHLTSPSNVPMFLPGTFSVTTDEPSGIVRHGSTVRGHTAFMGVLAEWTSEIIDFDEPKTVATKTSFTTHSGYRFSAAFAGCLEPVAEGTLLSINVRTDSGFNGMFGDVADEIVTIAYSRLLQASLMNLADVLDTGKRRNLTSRHREVLRMIQQGLTDREIAEKLYISPKTVGHHVSAILAAFRVTQRQDLRRSIDLPDQ
ncbi:LuxR C-terminal-related transcriptional regulator [Smaragdicoccus niigatensis]|uniref:LuxR C-terminal-related transcriptional regulator n=1 Tax=Smaragdicoccus niigatensis TaxID=359359 RepID=UPI0003A426F7|nr:LuxR C-terminal-related transcriptional regulator [Smaragdicoccus niigatensis]